MGPFEGVKTLFSIGRLTVYYWSRGWQWGAYRGCYNSLYVDLGPFEVAISGNRKSPA